MMKNTIIILIYHLAKCLKKDKILKNHTHGISGISNAHLHIVLSVKADIFILYIII